MIEERNLFLENIKRKSLMYVFGKRVKRIVDVTDEKDWYRVKCEDVHNVGVYYDKIFEKENLLEFEIHDAMNQLLWIKAGNEFPT